MGDSIDIVWSAWN